MGNILIDNVYIVSLGQEKEKAEKASPSHSSFSGEIDYVDRARNEVNIKDSTEMGDALKELNNDDLDMATRMSGIDMRSRLHYIEISGILAFDSLIMMRVIPQSMIGFTRQKKRLAVSLNGQGRSEIAHIVAGKTDRDSKLAGGGSSFGDKLKGLFTPGQQNQGGQQ